MILQELSRARSFPEVSPLQGHRIYASSFQRGQLRLGFVVNQAFNGIVRDFGVEGRAAFLDVDWDGFQLRLICGHLHPGPEQGLYSDSLDSIRFLANSTNRLLVIGADVQDCLRISGSSDSDEFVGEFTYGTGGWKGEAFVDFL